MRNGYLAGTMNGKSISDKQDMKTEEIEIFVEMLPPPVSLDLLCNITNLSPTVILQFLEELVQHKYLTRYTERGIGHYFLTAPDNSRNKLRSLPDSVLHRLTKRALECIYQAPMDYKKKCLHLAHIYQLTAFPIQHLTEVIKAGDYCLQLDLPMDAAHYYKMVLESIEGSSFKEEERLNYVDAAIGYYTCKVHELSPKIQRRYLDRALDFSNQLNDASRKLRIHVLLAKTYAKSVDNKEATRHINIAWQMLTEHEFPPEVKLRIALAHSEILFWMGQIKEAIECYESVIGGLEELPSAIETLKSCLRLGLAYTIAGETGRGLGLIREIHKRAQEIEARDLELYSALFATLALANAGRIGEAKEYIEDIFNTSSVILDNYLQWPGNGTRAFFAYSRGELDQAFYYLDLAWQHSKVMGIQHHHGPYVLDVLLGLEEAGMVHPEWTFEWDVQRLINWPDIYMQGVAYRFRALKGFRQGKAAHQIHEDLDKSISLLTQAGAKIEMAHSQVLLARVLLSERKTEDVGNLLENAWKIFSKANPKLFPDELRFYLDHSSKNALWIESLLEIGNVLIAKTTREEMLGKIISQAMRIAGAERGAIFLLHNQRLEMVAGRNLSIAETDDPAFSCQMEVMYEACQESTEFVREFEPDSAEQADESHLHTWTACLPIKLKNSVLGVIFMNSGLHQISPPKEEMSILRIISNQAAVALDNMETYEEIIDRNSELQAETLFYRERFEHSPIERSQMIGHSKQFYKMLNLIDQVAKSDTTVMITGETGVGKDMVARAIHQHSDRSDKPFIAVNMITLSPDVIASELFGHEKGAFTGAVHTHKGRFELASKGTLLLDDIDALPPEIQVKMLRILESREFERVGGTETLSTNFRLLASSNRDLEQLVDIGQFRSDFYYRLNVFPIKVPSLRERKEDIPLLACHFMEMFSTKFGKKITKISKGSLELLQNYSWPGNIRELRHVIERAVLLSHGSQLIVPQLNTLGTAAGQTNTKPLTYREMEIRHIREALAYCRGKVSGKGSAAELLELNPATLYSKMRKLGIEKETYLFKKNG